MTEDEVAAIEAAGVGWVPGDGEVPADLVFVGEAPGWQEVIHKRSFVGESGTILWQFASRYGHVGRPGAYVTNWHKIQLDDGLKKQYKKDPTAMEPWTRRLEAELDVVRPKTVVALGGYAQAALLGPDYSLFWSNGIPIDRGDFVVIGIVHPAAGLHEPTMLERTASGFAGLRRYLDGDVAARPWRTWNTVGPTLTLDEAPLGEPAGWIGLDTEGTEEHPFCITVSFDGETSRIVYADDVVGVAELREWLVGRHIVMHNAVWDIKVLRAIGIDLLAPAMNVRITDTMVLAFNLQDVPRNLKDLSRRELSVDMVEYEELVRPYLEQEEFEWRGRLLNRVNRDIQQEQQFTPKTKKPQVKNGLPVFKAVGPALQLSIHKHLTRNQNLSLNERHWGEREIGKLSDRGTALSLVPPAVHRPYAGRDAVVTHQIYPRLYGRVADEGLKPVAELDHQAIPLLRSMMDTGLHFDIERYWDVLGYVSTRKEAVEREIREIVGNPDFNPGSSQQLAEYIASETSIPLVKLTKTGRTSTESNVLSQLKHEHPIIPLELEYRELDKYEGTYLLPAGQLVRPTADGFRLFPDLSQTAVVSGRLAAYNPNVLAWPARTKLGLRIRSIFTAPEGKVLGSWDFSQIELRIVAALSGDPVMTEAFLSGRDLHQNLASHLFGVPYEAVDKLTQRTPSKTVHYCLLYGGGGGKVYEELRSMGITTFTRADCDRLVEDTWKLYATAGTFLKGKAREARQKGYVTSILGRRRFLPGVQLIAGRDEWNVRSLIFEAERQAGNFAIQGAAAELIKRAMAVVWDEVMPAVPGFRLWLQIHDELMGEVPADQWDRVNGLMIEAMTRDSWITSPIQIETEGKTGGSWDQLK